MNVFLFCLFRTDSQLCVEPRCEEELFRALYTTSCIFLFSITIRSLYHSSFVVLVTFYLYVILTSHFLQFHVSFTVVMGIFFLSVFFFFIFFFYCK